MAGEILVVSLGDSEFLPALLNPSRKGIAQVSADSAHNTRACHSLQ
ncbi:hypothetical protein GAGA_5001 [Paraglaciecola agarilytica NO2]|uniref:Uncharacterized protein n=1 Tax=Paraglaciecola agarilytica NO2 TaxID=1125747 RepID=A0ABQ0IEN3_9ALTE|nr:hypothetical protein GAGA_5001 [Paraglaciecola agarilytica NO2]